jgi:polar amino acid transport system substrate-binding protein
MKWDARFLFVIAGILGVSLGELPSWAVPLQTIRDRGFLSVGVKTNLFPMGFRDEAGKIIGFEISMARKLAQELLGSEDAVRLVSVRNVDRLQAVAEGRVDVTIAAVTATDSRRRWVDFTAPYYFERSTVAVQASSSFQSLEELWGEGVAVIKASSAIEDLEQDGLDLKLVEVESYTDALAQLRSGQVKAVVGDRIMLLGLVRQDGAVRLLKEEFGLYPMAIAMPKGVESASLRSGVNEAVDRWQKNGWLREQWLLWDLDR